MSASCVGWEWQTSYRSFSEAPTAIFMRITIAEQQLTGKRSPETCEDGIVATDDFVAVIDGSTSKAVHQLLPNMRNGCAAMLLVSKALRSLPADASLAQCCERVTEELANAYRQQGVSADHLIAHPEERATASAAIFSLQKQEIWLVGDCQCMVDGVFYDNPKPHEDRIAHERAAILLQMLEKGETDIDSLRHHDIGRDQVVGQIVLTCHDQNKKFSVFDGFPVALDKVKVIPVPTGSEVVLATDGYPFLFPTLSESEAALTGLLATDPLCIRQYVATKGLMVGQVSFDDRAYIRFRVIQ